MSLPAISLGDWCEQKGWDRGRWVGIYTQRVKTTWVFVGLAKKIPSEGSLYKWSWKTVISPHRASMHAVFKWDLFASIA